MGDVLPNQKSFVFRRSLVGAKQKRDPVELGNVTQKVQNAILSVLNMFFACKCDEFTDSQIDSLDKMGTIMEAYINVLWTLKQAIMYEPTKSTLMRKLHSHNHIGQHIRMFGPIWYADTSDWESAHKFFTTGVWRGTSKRKNTIDKEMLNATIAQSHAGHFDFSITLLEEDGVAQCQKSFGPKESSEGLTINPFTNVSDIRFVVTSEQDSEGNNILKGVGRNKHLFKESLFVHSSLSSSKFISQQLSKISSHEMWDKITEENTMYEFSIVRCASYEGSKDSDVGKGVIYARGKRYDYVNVKVEQEENGEFTEGYQVAQVLLMLQCHKHKNIGGKRVHQSTKWFFVVQYMKIMTIDLKVNKPHTSHESIHQLQWEKIPIANNQSRFNIDIVSLDSIAGSAMVIPYFSTFYVNGRNKSIGKLIKTPPINGKSASSDTFWYVDRKFFDRSGWEELVEINSIGNSNMKTTGVSNNRHNDIQAFILRNYIQPAIPDDTSSAKKSKISEDDDISISDGDSEEDDQDDEDE